MELQSEEISSQNHQEQERLSYSRHPQTVLLLPIHSTCYICNASYLASPGSSIDETRNRILSICRGFGISEESEKNLLLKLTFTDPFCVSCSVTVNQLAGWVEQLDLVQESIYGLKKIISQAFLSGCSTEERRVPLNDEYIRRKLIEKYKGTLSVPYRAPESAPGRDESELRLCYESQDKCTINYNDLIHVPLPVPAPQETDVLDDPVPSPLQEDDKSDVENNFFDDMEIADSMEVTESVSTSPTVIKKKKVRRSNQRRKQISSPRPPRQNSIRIMADPSGQCHLCPKTFPTQHGLSRHIRRQHFGVNFDCRYCGKSFNCSSNRNRHEIAAHIATTRDFICELCGKDYKTQPDLQDHRNTSHLGKKSKQHLKCPSLCTHCGKVLSTKRNLTTHIRIHHRHQYVRRDCPTCGKPFKDPQSLRQHERSHLSIWEKAIIDGVKLFYKCEICPPEQLGFNSKIALTEHYTKEHKNEPVPVPNLRKLETKPLKSTKQYTCTECPHHPSYTTRFALKQHIDSGHGIRWKREPEPKLKYPCEICGKPCKDRHTARRHADTHVPKVRTSVYKCEICGTEEATFTRIKYFREHYAKCHADEEIPDVELCNNRKLPVVVYCPDCPEHPGFTTKKSLQKHIRNGHGRSKRGRKSNGPDVLYCPDCPNHPVFSTKRTLRKHIKNGHKRRGGRKSNVEKGLPPPVRKSRAKQKIKQEIDSSSSMSESECDSDSDPHSDCEENASLEEEDYDVKPEIRDLSTEEWVVPEPLPVMRSRRGREIKPTRKNGGSLTREPSHDNFKLKELRVALPRCNL